VAGTLGAGAARAMTRLAAVLLLLSCYATGAGAADTMSYADPQPSAEAPRRIVLSLTENDPARINAVLNNVAHVQQFYGAGRVRIELVAYGPGVAVLLKSDTTFAERLEKLQQVGLLPVACHHSLDAQGKTPDDLLPGVTVVPSGVPEIVERQLMGWIYVRP